MKHSKGIVGAVFDVRNKILGNKKKPDQEATAVINFRTKELEVSPQKIRETSLDYLVNLLENDEADTDVFDDVALTKRIHVFRQMKVKQDEPEDMLNQDDIDEVFAKMKKKGNKYSFILRAGNNFRRFISQLYSKIWSQEEKPGQWRNTKVIATLGPS